MLVLFLLKNVLFLLKRVCSMLPCSVTKQGVQGTHAHKQMPMTSDEITKMTSLVDVTPKPVQSQACCMRQDTYDRVLH